MSQPRLPTHLIVSAQLRRLQAQGIACYIVHKGADESGTILLRSVMSNTTSKIYVQTRDIDGKQTWMDIFDTPADNAKVEATIAKQRKNDPDLWVIEIEDKNGKNLFE